MATCVNTCGLNTHLHGAPVNMQVSEISLPPVPEQGTALHSTQALPRTNKHAVGQIFTQQLLAGDNRLVNFAQNKQPFDWTCIECISICKIARNPFCLFVSFIKK